MAAASPIVVGDLRAGAAETVIRLAPGPAAIEHDGKLYITYTRGKEDCGLSIIPLSALAVK